MQIKDGSEVAIANANITWEGTNIGTMSDKDGNYMIKLMPSTGTLVVTFVGYKTGYDVTDGINNVAVGGMALENLTSGADNIVIGNVAGQDITTTTKTVLIGRDAGKEINSTDADGTIAIGYKAGLAITSGIAFAGVGNPMNSSFCRSSKLNFDKRKTEKTGKNNTNSFKYPNCMGISGACNSPKKT